MRAGVLHKQSAKKFRKVRSEHATLQKILISKFKGKDDADFVFWQ